MLNFCAMLIMGASVNLFETPVIFPEPLAYSRTPETSFQVASATKLFEYEVKYFKAEIGRIFPILTLDLNEDHQFQLAGAAGSWLTLGYKDGAFPMLTEDFLISLPVYYRYKSLFFALKYNHISAHLGDGVEKILRKNLSKEDKELLFQAQEYLDPYGVSIRLKKPMVYSRDFWSFQSAYKFNFLLDCVAYTNAGYINKSRPKHLNRWFYGGGLEAKYPTSVIDFIYSQDIMHYEDMESTDYSSELGFEVAPDKNDLFQVRLVLTAYVGSDRRGQLLGQTVKEFGIGLVIR